MEAGGARHKAMGVRPWWVARMGMMIRLKEGRKARQGLEPSATKPASRCPNLYKFFETPAPLVG